MLSNVHEGTTVSHSQVIPPTVGVDDCNFAGSSLSQTLHEAYSTIFEPESGCQDPGKLVSVLRWCTSMANLMKGLPWRSLNPSVSLTTDASLKAWGAHNIMDDHKVQGDWTPQQSQYHINVLEMLAVFKAFGKFFRYPTRWY
jgi:hypothetical protein